MKRHIPGNYVNCNLSQFSTDIRHIEGKDNLVADALSRIEAVTVIDCDAIADAQVNDADLQRWKQDTSLKFKARTLPSSKILWCNISTNNIRPFVLYKFRQQIFRHILVSNQLSGR